MPLTAPLDMELAMFTTLPGLWLAQHDFDGLPLRSTATARDGKGREYYIRLKLVPAQDWTATPAIVTDTTPDD